VVELAVEDTLKGGDRVLEGTSLPWIPVKISATWKGCDMKRWILRARSTVSLSSSESSSMPRMAIMSWSDL
jgi:hypothetical protein